ncbi:MAG: 3-hydroxyacyl-CoA dehydrogenase [Bacteroidota bacterium]
MKVEDIKNFLVLGAGTLGMRVGLQAAISGFNVKIYDISEKSFERAKQTHLKLLSHLEKEKRFTGKVNEVLSRIQFTANLEEATRDADFVNESVTEDLNIKKSAWEKLDGLCPDHTIFTTNTSYMLPSMFLDFVGRTGKFCAFHFHDVFFANVVDVMPHPGTDREVVNLLMEMGKKLDQIPVLVEKENPGYLFNSMLMAVIGAAGNLAVKDIASIEDIDRSWMGNFKMPMGPFGILDEIGLDTAWHVSHNQKDAKSQRFAEFLKTYIDKNELGVKTGKGFYTYPNPRFKDKDFLFN